MVIEHLPSDALGKFTWEYGDSKDSIAKQAFRSVLLVSGDDFICESSGHALAAKWIQETKVHYNVTVRSMGILVRRNTDPVPQYTTNHSQNYPGLATDGIGVRRVSRIWQGERCEPRLWRARYVAKYYGVQSFC